MCGPAVSGGWESSGWVGGGMAGDGRETGVRFGCKGGGGVGGVGWTGARRVC